ncbi:MAG: isoleucine--tRNA ligase [Anaerolineae bacterium]|nr:MAG: isoleucine--tRNA ligase [Anaerolineae bacterium]
MFEPVPTKVDFVKQEHEILRFWSDNRAFDALRELRKDGPRWSFIDGPITANNPMGVHHGWGRTYKDLFHRFKSMQGHHTRYQNGFDCQGLWVEVEVEREKGFETKRDIEKFGLAEFVVLCKQRVLKFAAIQTEQSIRLGYWMDWDHPEQLNELSVRLGEDPMQTVTMEGPRGPVSGTAESMVGRLGSRELGGSYFTLSDANNYTIWAVLKSCYDRGWIYKGRDVMPWCGRCGTGLSQHEIVTEGYQELTHPSLTLRLPLVDRPGESLLVWTTTPWTLTSNVAAAVGPDLAYVRVRQDDEILYLSRGTLEVLEGEYEIEAELTGKELEGWRYEGPFDELPAQVESKAPEMHRVILWEEVGEEEGTGIVHIAPGAGAEDYRLGKEHELPVIAPLNEAGVFVEGFDWLSGLPVAESAIAIHENLLEKNLVYRFEDYTHRYPVCWRCGEELVFRLVDEWFISMGEQLDKPYSEVTEEEKAEYLRYQMMEVVINETKWHPSFGLERELDWLRNMHDWMISKKRYWGLALPIYECSHCGNFEVIGSKDELKERAIEGWAEFEGRAPHRPFIDKVQIACRHCGEAVSRIPDVGSPWLDAGVVGMSTLSYGHDREYWAEWFPADLISESFPGQFRNWFYSLLAMSTVLERRAPFRNVFSYATLLAEDGRAMHKSWGNSIEFNEAADKMGVDVMRWLYCDHQPEKDLLFGYHHADEVRRQFLLPLWNVYSFLVTYARIDNWRPGRNGNAAYSQLDRWIQARFGELTQHVTEALERFEPHTATGAIRVFLDDLSNWYLRRSRRRFWAKAGASDTTDADKEAAYQTLYGVLVELIKLLAPFVPFVTESLYQNLVSTEEVASVHHCDWPAVDRSVLDSELTDEMALVKRLVSLGHAARNQAQIRLRQPLREAAFAVAKASERDVVAQYADIIRDELNVKEVRLLDAVREAAEYQLKPLPKQLGQKHGAQFPAVRSALLAMDADPAAQRLLNGDSIDLKIDGERLEVLPSEVEVQVSPRAGFTAAAEGAYLAALVTKIDRDLHHEGLANEVVRRVQELRKKAEFSVDDRINLQYSGTRELMDAIEAHRAHIAAETLSLSLEQAEEPTGTAGAEYKFQKQELRIAISKSEKE